MELPREIESLKEEIRAEVERSGAELIDITSRKSGGRGVLTLLVDKPGGITLQECVNINNSLGHFLDDRSNQLADQGFWIPGPYFLEVSSPGLDRPLKNQRDFERAVGSKVRIHWRNPAGQSVLCVGGVISAGPESVHLETKESGLLEIYFEQILKAVREIGFSSKG
ncbi:MAG: ribosome maturation factor RimP [Candidatus Omnitrophica bacterium]|nr:ribosome maturation factor RimP [Candidatus Omnitrophota bacterium]